MTHPQTPQPDQQPTQPLTVGATQPVPRPAPEAAAWPAPGARPGQPAVDDPYRAWQAQRAAQAAQGAQPSQPHTAADPWAHQAAPAAPADGTTPTAPRPRTPWVPMATTAVAAALVASLTTAGAVGAFDRSADAATTPSATEDASAPAESTTVPVSGSSAEQPDWQAVADAVRPSVVAIDVRTQAGAGQGSGVVIDTEGHVLTNDHVVGDAVDGGLQVTLWDGRVLEAEVVGTDPTTDLAVIRLVDPPSDLQAASLGDSDALTVGDPVMAVGNPLGLDSTVTTGIVSALDRPVSTQGEGSAVVTNAIQADAAINPGNSGGPLFDATGRVIGITSSIASLSSGGGQAGSIGLGFSIPANLAQRVADELVADGTADHAFLGVGLGDGTGEADGVTRRGAVVQEVTSGSPADEAGLETGDVVVAIDGDAVSGAESLTGFVRERAAGDVATLTVVRDGRSQDVEVTLAVREETAAQPEQQQPQQSDPTDPGSFPWDFFGQG